MEPRPSSRHPVIEEIKAFFRPGLRMIDEVECATSVLLAILFAHLIHADNVSWAAFSGYMVMRGHVADSLLRGVLRIIGTATGAGLAVGLVPLIRSSMVATTLAAAVMAGATVYLAITGKRAYAWLFIGLTFEMILLDTLEHPALAIDRFARTRLLEVMAGTTACLLISTLSAMTLRKRWPGVRMAKAARIGWHRQAARHAGQAMVAVALLPCLWSTFHIPELAQSAVTIMAAMLLPVSSIGVSGFVPVSRRLLQRIAGCLAGSGLAALCLFASDGHVSLLIAGTAVAVAIGRHIENGRAGVAYVGTQFTLAVLVTLVPDSYAKAAIGPAHDRLIGILIGMALLEPVLIGWHLVSPARKTHPLAPDDPVHGE